MPALAKAAPSFTLRDQNGAEVSLASIDTDFIILYFYPKDDTPGCTIEAREFSKLQRDFAKRAATVFGVSGGDSKSKAKFCQKYALRISLLADEDFVVAKRFGAYGQKSFMGRTFKGIRRSTFVLDKRKRIVKSFMSVKALGHAQEVLTFLDSLLGRDEPASTKSKPKKSGSAPRRAKAPAAAARRSQHRATKAIVRRRK